MPLTSVNPELDFSLFFCATELKSHERVTALGVWHISASQDFVLYFFFSRKKAPKIDNNHQLLQSLKSISVNKK